MIRLDPAMEIDFDLLADVIDDWRRTHVMALEARETGRDVTHLVEQEQTAEYRVREVIGDTLTFTLDEAMSVIGTLLEAVVKEVTEDESDQGEGGQES